MLVLPEHIEATSRSMTEVFAFFESSARRRATRQAAGAAVCDFVTGNPQELPLPAYVETLRGHLHPQSEDWFAYQDDRAPAREHIASTLRQRTGLSFAAEDIFLTTGASAALATSFTGLLRPSDEVLLMEPGWFSYESRIRFAGGRPIWVKTKPESHALDLDAIAEAITPKTHIVVLNSPNNPTGQVYSADSLRALGRTLEEASERNGRPIWLLSDASYSRIIFDGADYPEPACHYAHVLVAYTYGKTLLTPGQRLGYLAVSPSAPAEHRRRLREALPMSRFLLGYSIPNALLQRAIPDLEGLSIDVAELQAKRDLMLAILREAGYEVDCPAGSFYVLPRSPWADDTRFVRLLESHDVFCHPGALLRAPGTFRLSLTATREMIHRSAVGFREALRTAQAMPAPRSMQ